MLAIDNTLTIQSGDSAENFTHDPNHKRYINYTHYTERNGDIRFGRTYVQSLIFVLEKNGFQFWTQEGVRRQYSYIFF